MDGFKRRRCLMTGHRLHCRVRSALVAGLPLVLIVLLMVSFGPMKVIRSVCPRAPCSCSVPLSAECPLPLSAPTPLVETVAVLSVVLLSLLLPVAPAKCSYSCLVPLLSLCSCIDVALTVSGSGGCWWWWCCCCC